MHDVLEWADALIPAILAGLAFAISVICGYENKTPMKAVTVYWVLVFILWAIRVFG